MKNHFFIPYYGNKRQEVNEIYEFIKHKLDDIEYIVEPFCGTSAFSYFLSLKHPGKFKYILNDNNKFIYKLYTMSQAEREETQMKLMELKGRINNKDDYVRELKDWDKDFIKYLFANKYYSIRPGLYPQNKTMIINDKLLTAPIMDMIKSESMRIYNKDAMDIYKEFKDNKKALIFLDPPYLSSDNSWYKTPTVGVYEYLFDNDIIKEKAYIVLCLANIWIIKLLFKDKKSSEYDKKYETTKKNIKHIIISNEKIIKK